MASAQYRIGELADKAGVTKRTIHYYMARGLLPASQGSGLGTTYSDEHLYRIMLIKKLQDQYLPLDQIRKRMIDMPLEEVKRCLENQTAYVSEQPVKYSVSKMTGSAYNRIPVGFGVEIHFPSDDDKAVKLAEKLYQYVEKMMKEG
jgi:DNA-binding transcriptional MerR regulator